MNIGVVCSDLTEKNGDILVEWFNSKERSSERRCMTNGQLRIRMKKPFVAGIYTAKCFPLLEYSAGVEEEPHPSLSEPSDLLSLGDRVLVDPGIDHKGYHKHVSILNFNEI